MIVMVVDELTIFKLWYQSEDEQALDYMNQFSDTIISAIGWQQQVVMLDDMKEDSVAAILHKKKGCGMVLLNFYNYEEEFVAVALYGTFSLITMHIPCSD